MGKLGVALFPKGVGGPRGLMQMVRGLEDQGIDHFYLVEGGNDPLTALAAIAVATARAEIGSSIANIYVRHPYQMAYAAATVEALAPGRFVLGLGTAHQVTNINWLGLDMTKPLSRMRDYVEAVRGLLDAGEQPANIKNERYQITGARLAWPPQRRVPIFLAALGDGSVRLAGRIADGIITSLATLSQIRRMRAILDEEAAAAGREPGSVKIYPIVNTTIRAGKAEAMPILKQAFAGYSRMPYYQREMAQNGIQVSNGQVSDEDAEQMGIAGPADYARERIAAFHEAGADVVLLSPGAGESDPATAYQSFAALV